MTSSMKNPCPSDLHVKEYLSQYGSTFDAKMDSPAEHQVPCGRPFLAIPYCTTIASTRPFLLTVDATGEATANTPLAPSVEKAYYRKCIELKRRLNDVEDANDQAKIKRVRLDRAIMKLRLERAFLLEQLSKRMDPNVDGSEGSGDDGMATPPPDRPHRDKRKRPSASAAVPASSSQPPAPPSQSQEFQDQSTHQGLSAVGANPPLVSAGPNGPLVPANALQDAVEFGVYLGWKRLAGWPGYLLVTVHFSTGKSPELLASGGIVLQSTCYTIASEMRFEVHELRYIILPHSPSGIMYRIRSAEVRRWRIRTSFLAERADRRHHSRSRTFKRKSSSRSGWTRDSDILADYTLEEEGCW
nr:hypothetical protein CFP56_70237 [Quercus suber]